VAELRSLIRALDVEGDVTFLGEREDVAEILAATDLLLAPSWEEPFGRAVIEALAMEVPVAATAVGGPAEILQPGVDGVLLPPRRPETWTAEIVELLGDQPRLRAMGANGRRNAELRFGVAQHVEAIAGVYAEALADRR
jgi:glycosyltransferase involved in cell wall biosynthesis